MRKELIAQLQKYEPFNEQEAFDKEIILKALAQEADIFQRENSTHHMTASAWIVNERRDRALMIYHNIYDSWSWTGGHADGDENLLEVAIREAKEECGISNVRAATEDIFSIEVLTVDGHEKRGSYVSSHLHLNVTYLLIADESDQLKIKEDENSGVKWFSLEGAVESSTEEWFKKRIYNKLNAKLRKA